MRFAVVAIAAVTLLALTSVGAAWTPADPPAPVTIPVEERELGNGLRVLVHEDHDIPNVALYVVWKVGSRNERPGITGLAHFFEHMMFVGGRRYGTEFDPVMEAAGGSNNAWTSQDVTVYQDWFPVSALELVLDMEADRMSGMVFTDETVESERGVVASERRLSMEEPWEVMYEQLQAAAYTAHPYQWSVLGWMVDIENWRRQDLEQFFRTHYAPENATLVVAGDVTAARVFELAEEKMGSIPRGPGRRDVHTREPEQVGQRRVVVEDPGAQLPRVMAAWHIPATSHSDFPALDVLEKLLVTGESSRLHRLLVEEEGICLSVSGGWQGHQFDASLFTLDLACRSGQSTAMAEQRAYAELTRLAAEGPTERELEKALNTIRAGLVRRMRTIDGKASLIAETDTFFGGWQRLPDRAEAVWRVTAEDVKRVLNTYFTTRNRTVCTLVIPPASEGEQAEAPR